MSKMCILKLKQPLFIKVPNGPFTAEDTGVLVFPTGEDVFAGEESRKKYDEMGIAYEVLHECDREEFWTLVKKEAEKRKAERVLQVTSVQLGRQ